MEIQSQMSKAESYLLNAILAYEKLQTTEVLHEAVAMHIAALEEQKLLYKPRLDDSLAAIHAEHAFMEGQISLMRQIQSYLTKQTPTEDTYHE